MLLICNYLKINSQKQNCKTEVGVFGESHAQFLPLLTSDTPGAPYKLEGSDIAKDSVTLTWLEPDEDGGSPIIGYWVERYEPDHDRWIRCNKLPIKDTNYR